MPYVAPSTVTTLQTYTSAAHNVIVGDIIDLDARQKYLATQTLTSNYSMSATSVAAATDIFAADLSFTAVSGKLYRFEWFFKGMDAPSGGIAYRISLVNGAGADQGTIVDCYNGDGGNANFGPITGSVLYAAGSGAVSFNLRGWKTGGSNGSLNCAADAGAGRLTVYGPMD